MESQLDQSLNSGNSVFVVEDVQNLKRKCFGLIDASQIVIDENSSGGELVVSNGSKTTLRLLLIDSDVNFTILPWKLVADQFNALSPSWSYVAFSNDLKAVIFTESNQSISKKFLTADSITCGGREINISIEEVFGRTRGIVYSKFLIPTTEDNILSALQNQGVFEIYKIQKSSDAGEKFYTGSVILNFKGDQIPQSVIIDGVTLYVNKLNPKPMLCSHCGILGHTIKKCKRLHVPFCKDCFGEHAIEDNCFVRCKNCKELHLSSDKKCEAVLREIEILKLKEHHNISYSDAKAALNSSGGSYQKEIQLFEDRDINRKLEVIKLKESYSKLSAELKQAREKVQEADKKICEFEQVIVPNLQREILNVKKECENDKIQQQKEFTDALGENMNEIKSLSDQNIKVATDLQKLQDKILSMDLKYESLQAKNSAQETGFEEFVNFSDVTFKEYQRFVTKKQKDGSSLIGLIPKSRGRSTERKHIVFTAEK